MLNRPNWLVCTGAILLQDKALAVVLDADAIGLGTEPETEQGQGLCPLFKGRVLVSDDDPASREVTPGVWEQWNTPLSRLPSRSDAASHRAVHPEKIAAEEDGLLHEGHLSAIKKMSAIRRTAF